MGAATAVQSAETLATLRALAVGETSLAVRCEDRFARHFLARKSRLLLDLAPRSLLTALLNFAAPGSYCFAIARTRHFDEALLAGLEAGIEQLVLLGAGYDSRPFRFEKELAGISIFEVDHPGTQARKKRVLGAKFGRLPANLTLVECDFTRQLLPAVLARQDFRPDRKTLFLWEGVSYYLPQVAVDEVLAFVARCASGSGVVFDYSLRAFVDGDDSTYGGKQVASWLQRIGEPFLFGLDEGQAPAFLARHNLSVVSDLGPAELEQRYLSTGEHGTLGPTLGHVRIVHAQTPQTGDVR